MIMNNNHSKETHRILHEKYRSLEGYKIHAINRAIKKFESIPLEIEDFEHAAWTAFLEVEKKYKEKKWEKTYENFFIDSVYWKSKDYCKKFINNKHRIINYAVVTDFTQPDYKDDEFDEKDILKKLAIDHYINKNADNEKGQLTKLIRDGLNINKATEHLSFSKSRTYRVMKMIRSELKVLLDI